MASVDLQIGTSSSPARRRLWRGDGRTAHPFWTLLVWCLVSFITTGPLPAQAQPDWTQYNVPFGGLPTFSQRAALSIEYLACALENRFLETTLRGLGASLNINGSDPEAFRDNGLLEIVIAKLQWRKLSSSGCTNTYNIVGNAADFYDLKDFPNEEEMQEKMAKFGSDCSGAIVSASAEQPTVNSQISGPCLTAQINFVLGQLQQGDRYPGTDPLPCNITGSQKGDWDVTMMFLIRILFLDNMTDVAVLSQSVHDHVQNDLISLRPDLGPDTYSVTGCGDNEKDTGSPQEREENDGDGGVLDSVGDFLSWLFRRLLEIGESKAGLIAAATGQLGSLYVAAGLAEAVDARIPETENHRLMIESTRFLNNQLNIQALGSNAPNISGHQSDVKDWLLNTKFKDIARNDFVEYNARPYQQYSLTALRNLADFATDSDVRTGAQMLLEYSAAKFAVGSNQGRRLVPFRRRLQGVKCIYGGDCEECYIAGCHCIQFDSNGNCVESQIQSYEIFHPAAYEDFQVSLALLFNGDTRQLLNGLVPVDMLDAPAATSQFIGNIPSLIGDIAANKEFSYLQRIHHAGYEIYSSSPSALITAGGIETGHANHLMVGPVPIPTPADPNQDIGAGLPTTVMFTGNLHGVTEPQGQSRMTIRDFITFGGNLSLEGDAESFTDNLCVWQNFACGINLGIPPDIAGCLVGQKGAPPPPISHWYFLDSSACPGYATGPKFYLVLYIICGQDECFPDTISLNPTNAGFLEVVDNPGAFDTFQTVVLSNNPTNPDGSLGELGQGCLTGGDCKGLYHTFSGSGHDLELHLRGHQDDSDKTGIISVDGVAEKDLDEWPLAEGDIINSQGDGVISIKNLRVGFEIILDFSDTNHPCRRNGPGQTCTQN